VAGVDWTTLVGAMSRVEHLTSSDSGLLSFGRAPKGGIFVEQGRVCWVAASGRQRRLKDLLRGYARDANELDRVSERCRAEGLLLGQTLVAEGLLQPWEFEGALRRHSAECLVDLCRNPSDTTWYSHVGRGYAPRFTFCARDLLFDSVALLYPNLRLEAQEELSRFDEPGRRSVAFLMDDSLRSFLPLAETGGTDVDAMLALGVLAGLPRAGRELAVSPTFALSTNSAGATVLTWWRQHLLFVVWCPDRPSLAFAIQRLRELRER
jgi:hypothetical protein